MAKMVEKLLVVLGFPLMAAAGIGLLYYGVHVAPRYEGDPFAVAGALILAVMFGIIGYMWAGIHKEN